MVRIRVGSRAFPALNTDRAILRDETHYPNPEEFRPERYLKDGHLDRSVPDPHVPFFGWGRRVCVGKHFADASVWLAIATVLHCFTISPPKDAQGNDVVPKVELRSGLVTYALAFLHGLQKTYALQLPPPVCVRNKATL